MDISMRSILTAGVAAVTATAIVAAPSVQPLPHHRSAEVSLAAAVQQPTQQEQLLSILRSSPRISATTPGGATPTLAPIPPLINLANAIDNTYNAIEPWVQYGFQVAASVVAWIPVAGWFSGQIMVFYTFGEGIVASAVFNTTDWMRGDGGIVANIGNFAVDVGLAFIWLGLDEVSQFIPLPPLPWYPPRPPAAPLGLFSTFAAPNALAGPTVQAGPIGNAVIDASNLLAQASLAVWNVWDPISAGIDYGVGIASAALNSVSWIPLVPLANFELNETWNLIQNEGNQIDWFAEDMINAGNQFVWDAFNVGPIYATNQAALTTVNSVVNRGGTAIYYAEQFVRNQINYFNPFSLAQQRASADQSASRSALPAAIDRVAGELPGAAAVNTLLTKAKKTIAVDLPAEITKGADGVTDAVKTPRKTIQSALKGEVAAANADTGKAVKALGKAPRTVAKGLDKGVKKAVKGLEKAGKSIERAVTRPTQKVGAKTD